MTRQGSWLSEERDAYVLGLLRAALGLLLLLQSARTLNELGQAGYFGDYFHMALVKESWVPARGTYLALLWLELGGAALAMLGIWPRITLRAAATIGLYLLLCDRLQYHNNRYALLLLAFLSSLTPCDRSFSVLRLGTRALAAAARRAPSWARKLLQAQVSLIYAASALGKLADADWRSGQVLAVRYHHTLAYLNSQGVSVPAFVTRLYSSNAFASASAKGAISLELFLALGLWLPWTRAFALWLGVLFHLGIELSARVELFSWLMWAAYLAFVTLECRERIVEIDPRSRPASLFGRFVRRLDVLKRFDVREASEPLGAGSALTVTDRRGRSHHGLGAVAQIARAFPPLFLAWPLLALASALFGRRASAKP